MYIIYIAEEYSFFWLLSYLSKLFAFVPKSSLSLK